MYISERKALHESIRQYRPRQCFEIGTYTGGGSTFFLSEAFKENTQGSLITMENSEYYYQKALNYYADKLPEQNKYISFVFGENPDDFTSFIPEDKQVDCVFFDGAENGQRTLDQYNYFLPYFKTGSVIMFHDWNTEKTEAVRPVVIGNPIWEKQLELTPPNSVGFTIFKHL